MSCARPPSPVGRSARGAPEWRRPDSASASFFIVTAKAEALDGKYSAFGKIESGLDVVEKIEAVAVNGETPVERVELRKVTVVRR